MLLMLVLAGPLAGQVPEHSSSGDSEEHVLSRDESYSGRDRGASASNSTGLSAPADDVDDRLGSTYIPLDSWIYPAILRLNALGYAPSTYIGMRPWTRNTALHLLRESQDMLVQESAAGFENDQVESICDRLAEEFRPEEGTLLRGGLHTSLDSVYSRVTAINGPVLNDSYHLGRTFANDFGRPFQSGFNDVTGYSARAETGRFSLYFRGEYQHAPSAAGYSVALANTLSDIDLAPHHPQATIPLGPIASQDQCRFLEANLSARVLRHEISFGKSDAWLGPAMGASMAWGNNAENIYSFRINRVEPLHIPVLSNFVGNVKYDFFVGSLKGHADPNDPWVHAEKFTFRPTENFEFGFERTVIWGGKTHVPITIGTFLRSFFSPAGVDPSVKFSRQDPGARFSTFDFSYRVPLLRQWLTIYTDSLAHDNVFPVSNPGRSGFHPGFYLARFPRAPKLDFRAEAAMTDPHDPGSQGGRFLYYEAAQLQGYTNKGIILGDWVGREGKGGQAWLTWHLSGNELLQLEYRNAKAASDFIPSGTTQHDFTARALFRIRKQLEVNASMQVELWKAPILAQGQQKNVSGSLQVTYYPRF